ncbi:NAD(P)-dependent oxidoreductase [Alphaproteobacteria bacterium]|nr:NAD(P)-dependent oxidoreductase [Alphaproteobacteria bacterium]
MNIIITSGSGFIGTNLIEKIRGQGLKVYNINVKPPRNFIPSDNWVECDILDFKKLRMHFDYIKPDIVIHLASETKMPSQANSKFPMSKRLLKNMTTDHVIDITKISAYMPTEHPVQATIINSFGLDQE